MNITPIGILSLRSEKILKPNKTMTKSKITRTVFREAWNNPKGGVIYYHDIELENGDKGQIGTKTQTPEKLNPGQEIEYTLTKTERGNKIKINQPFQPGKPGGKYSSVGPTVGMAVNNSISMFIAGKIEKEKIFSTAEWLVKHTIELQNKFEK